MIDEIQAKQLADSLRSYIQKRRDEKEELFYKDKPKKNKQGVITNGSLNFRLLQLAKQYLSDQDEPVNEIEKVKKSKQQTSLEFQREKYKKFLNLLSGKVNDEINKIKEDLTQFLAKLDEEYKPVNWLTEWTPKAADISFATHVAKLTHSSSKSTSILDVTTETNNKYLTTNTLAAKHIDTASSNAASLPVSNILLLSVANISLLDCIKSNDNSFFKYITDDKNLIELWSKNLKQAYDNSKKQSYFLNKQIYFPTGTEQYHLLLPLTSSSLAHELYFEHQKFFSDESKMAREQKRSGLYSEVEVRSYPNKAFINATGSNHSNASYLNGMRSGKIALFSAMPPQWQSGPQQVMGKQSIFDRQLSYQLKDSITELRKYLILLKNKELSLSEPERNAAVARKLSVISDTFFDYIQMLSQNENTDGWTMQSELPIEQQLLLEPFRDDEIAIAEKLERQWTKKLGQSYGRWLNRQLKTKTLNLTPIHAKLWQQHFLIELREYLAVEEVFI